MSEEKIIHQFKKNANETVMVKFSEFKGKKLIDIRVFYLSEDGSWKPTAKGICLRRELISELKEAINKAEACVEDGNQAVNEDSAARTSKKGQGEGSANE